MNQEVVSQTGELDEETEVLRSQQRVWGRTVDVLSDYFGGDKTLSEIVSAWENAAE